MSRAEQKTAGATPAPAPARGPWTSQAGAWLGIGAAPGAMLVGAGMAARHHGAVPLAALVLGVLVMAAMLWFQGQLGLNAPGVPGGTPGVPGATPGVPGGTLSELATSYFGPAAQRVLGGVLGIAMIGWMGFNLGLGGAAISALLHLPGWLGPLILGLPIAWLALGGLGRWNVVTIVSTLTALGLMALVVVRLADHSAPVTLAVDDAGSLVLDIAAIVGYGSLFSTRSPDFSARLAGRRDLARCVALLCGSFAVVSLVGIGLERGTGSTDLVGILSSSLWIGNLLVAAAVVGALISTLYSGALALTAATGLSHRWGIGLLTGIGIALAVVRFDHYLGPLLGLLAAALPPLLVPMAVEGDRRRRGRPARQVPGWTWLPAGGVAVLLTLVHQSGAALIGLGVAALASALWALVGKEARA